MSGDTNLDCIIDKLTLEEKAKLCAGEDSWHTAAVTRLGVESIMMADGPHGLRRETGDGLAFTASERATCFPSASALGCSFDRALLEQVGEALGREARDQGVSLVLGPGANIKRSPLCGRDFEYLSEDPMCSGELAAAMINGLRKGGAGACIKHYACNSQENRRFVADSCVDERALHEIYLEAWRIAIKKSQPFAVMSSYNRVNGEYAGESETLIKGILRENFGFGGAVISDWGAVCDRVRGLQAGMDLEMPGGASGNERVIVQAVLCGELETTKLDAAVRNVLELVARCRALPESVQKCDYAANGALSRRAAAECAVLMKNDCGLLPLDKNKKIAVIGRFAQKARYQGAGSSLVNSRETSSALEEFAGIGMDCVYAEGYNDDGSTNDALLAKSREAVASAGRAVIFAGLPESCESEGYDRAGLELPDGMLKLIDVICSETSEVAVVLMLGAPVLLPFEPRVRSILCMYLGGEHAGAASVDVLTGARNPSGSLAETWPRSIADTPCAAYYGKKRKECEYREGIYVGYRYYEGAGVAPLYKFGHGLSYTRFEIDALSCPRTTLTDGEELEMSVRVRNVGAHEGTKTLFAFVKERDGDLVQLKSFEKVALNAGEQARITIKLDFDAFCYYNRALGKRCAKAGKYIVRLCGSLDDAGESVEISLDPADGREPPPYITAGEAPSVGDERFEQMLGFLPCEPPMRPYTLNSTLGELSRTAVGKLLLSVAESTVFSGQNELAPENEQTVRRSMLDVPIRALCALSKGALPPNLARAVVCFANGKIARGIKYAVKRKN